MRADTALRSRHHSVDHDVGQRVPPLPPGAHALGVVLELAVPLLCFGAILGLELRGSKMSLSVPAIVKKQYCSHHTHLEDERLLRENLLQLKVVLPVVLGAHDAPVQVERLPQQRVAAVLLAHQQQRRLADSGVAREVQQLRRSPVRLVAGTWLKEGSKKDPVQCLKFLG